MEKRRGGVEYNRISALSGTLVSIEGGVRAGYRETVRITCGNGERKRGLVEDIGEERAVIQVFEDTDGIAADDVRIEFSGRLLEFAVSEDLLGRILNGVGEPIDGAPPPLKGEPRGVYGAAVNPVCRVYPDDIIQTGISAIDGMNTLVRGQKLPVFSGAGFPHNDLVAQIVRQATIRGGEEERFAVVFAGMGLKNDDALFFKRNFEETGALSNTVMFVNLATDPPQERILTPRYALTLAEYLAFEKEMHVLVVLTDMTNYCEALREVSSAMGKIPSRKGYPGFLYSDLAEIYERCGRVRGCAGSVTQIPVLTMPNDDITHPIPDLTGYITEGQIVLSRELFQRNVYPPVDVLPSLSRIMKDAVGEGKTRADHPDVSNQLYAAYSRVGEVRALAAILGEDELTDLDRTFLVFGERFEREFVAQGRDENRSFEQTLDIAWGLLSILPRSSLTRIDPVHIEAYYRRGGED